MRREFLVFCLLSFCFIVVAAQNVSVEEDSLLNAMWAQEGNEKVGTIFRLALLYEGDEKMLHYIDKMEQYAREINDVYFIGSALVLRTTYYYNWGAEEQFLAHVGMAKEYLLRQDDKARYFAMESFVIEYYVEKGHYETALRIIEDMLQLAGKSDDVYGELNAYCCMGDVYMAGGYYDKALEAYTKSMELLDEWDSNKNFHRLEIGVKIVEAAYEAQQYDVALEYCNSVIRFGEERRNGEAVSGAKYHDFETEAYIFCAMIYLQQSDTLRARQALEAAEQFDYNLEEVGHLFHTGYAMYCKETGAYDRALQHIEQALEAYAGIGVITRYIDALQIKASILAAAGAADKAYEAMKEASIQADSLAVNRLATQISELRTIYQLDRLTIEKERNRNYFLFALGGCLLLSLLLGGVFYYNRVITRKNRGLYRQIKEQDRLAGELAQMRHEYELLEQLVPQAEKQDNGREPLPADKQQRALVARLHDYLLSGADRSHTSINRDELTAALATNKNTLSEAVKAVTGKTLMEYIRAMQLEEARRMLDKHFELTIEAIAYDCGFSAINTFYRLFKKQYGISPAEYRKMANSS